MYILQIARLFSPKNASSTNDPLPSALSVSVTITPAENWHIFERTYSQSYGLILVSQTIEVV